MKKVNLFHTIQSLLLIAALLFTVSCEESREQETYNGTPDGTASGVARADVNVILGSIESGEMMYKFSYLEPEVDKGDKEHLNYVNNIFNETWDRRLFLSVGDDYNGTFCIYDNNTDSYEKISLHYEDDNNYVLGNRYVPLPDGNYLVLTTSVSQSDIDLYNQNPAQFDNKLPHKLNIMNTDSTGKILESYLTSLDIEINEKSKKCQVDKAGYLYIADYNNVYVLSPECELLFTLEIPKWSDRLSLMRDNDGNVYYIYGSGIETVSEDTGMFNYVLQTIDIEKQCWTDPDECKKVPALATFIHGEGAKKLMFGGGLDYYYVDKYGIIGRNEGDTTTDFLFEWLDVGLSYDEVAAISIYSPELIFVALHIPGGDGYRYGKIELVTTESVYGKDGKPTTLKIAVDRDNNPSAAAILDYAASFIHSDYGCPVEIVNYTDVGNRSANQQLIKDISAGTGPDLVIFGGGLSYEVLNKSEIFVDLYELGGKGTDDLLPCVKKPFENDKGELNRLIFSFSLANVAGSNKNVRASMTVDELIKLNSSLENGQYLTYVTGLTDSSKQADKLFEKLIPNMLNDYIDYDKNTIDEKGLGELLKLCKEAKVYGVEWIFVDPNLFRDRTIALDISEVYDPAQFLLNRYINFSEDELEYIGFPGFDSASVRPFNSLAVLKSSRNQDLAWKLLRHMLDCQADRYSDCEEKELVSGQNALPATYSGINALFRRLERVQFLFSGEYYKANNGKETFSISINALSLGEDEAQRADSIVYSEDDRAALLNILESASVSYTTDSESIAIICEEASYYFSGTKSLDEVLKLIKSRIEIRLAE